MGYTGRSVYGYSPAPAAQREDPGDTVVQSGQTGGIPFPAASLCPSVSLGYLCFVALMPARPARFPCFQRPFPFRLAHRFPACFLPVR